MLELKGHFDGRVVVLDEPLSARPGTPVTVTVLPDPSPADAVSADEERRPMTGTELAKSDSVGAWAHRTDIVDSTEFVNELRARSRRKFD